VQALTSWRHSEDALAQAAVIHLCGPTSAASPLGLLVRVLAVSHSATYQSMIGLIRTAHHLGRDILVKSQAIDW
jgi:hypothetical protein